MRRVRGLVFMRIVMATGLHMTILNCIMQWSPVIITLLINTSPLTLLIDTVCLAHAQTALSWMENGQPKASLNFDFFITYCLDYDYSLSLYLCNAVSYVYLVMY